MTIEKVILVNENDEVLGEAEKLTAHQKAWCHRAFSVFIFRQCPGEWELLLQQRHVDKYHCGGLWTNTCCGHPRPGEATQAAAQRRLKEEMGLEIALKPVGVFHYVAPFDNGLTEDEVDHVFVGRYDNERIEMHPEEASDMVWVPLSRLRQQLAQQSDQFTPWFSKALTLAERGLG